MTGPRAHETTVDRTTGQCLVCGKTHSLRDLTSWVHVRPGISELIARDHPDWGEGRFICHNDLAGYQRRYLESLLRDERGQIGAIERQVLESVATGRPISEYLGGEGRDQISFGERMADRMAAFGGSWRFIIGFICLLLVWMAVNAVGLMVHPFDPYPFILLNLVLSCLAALQAPVIIMSQRR